MPTKVDATCSRKCGSSDFFASFAVRFWVLKATTVFDPEAPFDKLTA
jgi:hypothetical protein